MAKKISIKQHEIYSPKISGIRKHCVFREHNQKQMKHGTLSKTLRDRGDVTGTLCGKPSELDRSTEIETFHVASQMTKAFSDRTFKVQNRRDRTFKVDEHLDLFRYPSHSLSNLRL